MRKKSGTVLHLLFSLRDYNRVFDVNFTDVVSMAGHFLMKRLL